MGDSRAPITVLQMLYARSVFQRGYTMARSPHYTPSFHVSLVLSNYVRDNFLRGSSSIQKRYVENENRFPSSNRYVKKLDRFSETRFARTGNNASFPQVKQINKYMCIREIFEVSFLFSSFIGTRLPTSAWRNEKIPIDFPRSSKIS